MTKCQGKFPSRFVDKRKGKTAMTSLGTFLERNVNRYIDKSNNYK